MKYSRKSVERKAQAVPKIKFEPQQLTSFTGLVLWQPFLAAIDFKASLARCFRQVRAGKVYPMFVTLVRKSLSNKDSNLSLSLHSPFSGFMSGSGRVWGAGRR